MHADGIPEEAKDLVMHTYLDIAGNKLMICDTYPGSPYRQGNNFTIAYVSRDEAAIRDAFEKLKKDGKVEMEIQETPWSKAYGSLTDKFNIQWQFNLES
jgi:PhnB protein